MLIDRYFPNLTPRQREQFAAMPDLYKGWNAKINVISRKDIEQVEEHHILHSLAIAKTDLIAAGESVLDVGCGGGFPGIPLAVYYPDVQFTLVDSIGKKIKVVREVASALGLTNVRAEHCRVEQLDGGKSRFDWVVSRAVTDLKTFVGWTWGRTTYGILYLKGGDLEAEIAEAGRHTEQLPVSTWFDGEFFETKKVLVLPKK
ncbi:16S rRNA (guanine(527)-N(7))-methyltransferase RsmG [Millionella massiliensis]|uniref:16S rRNA (guanine(527)-N(7))-methyltransferase RsmG n=1 Tax=Millionella massiliensis TaxID=1871023 RepID=UPI0024B85E0F|nr:16S rRNA (guanine(527)-N(7))-methyltransferase RsmG [Millionella massiliensis]